jgi:hypothetical protein
MAQAYGFFGSLGSKTSSLDSLIGAVPRRAVATLGKPQVNPP